MNVYVSWSKREPGWLWKPIRYAYSWHSCWITLELDMCCDSHDWQWKALHIAGSSLPVAPESRILGHIWVLKCAILNSGSSEGSLAGMRLYICLIWCTFKLFNTPCIKRCLYSSIQTLWSTCLTWLNNIHLSWFVQCYLIWGLFVLKDYQCCLRLVHGISDIKMQVIFRLQ